VITRLLGAHGPRVPALGLGCMGMSELWSAQRVNLCNTRPERDAPASEDHLSGQAISAMVRRAHENS
jgi:aryl-alcohol dehydrogenase-like predicted oxidoreductase